ncbi:hypothetical protein DIPPA_32593 [Diplonema papillatum]|nr:hypothetical protein DIPPA_32593 [Diplonema papillatum]
MTLCHHLFDGEGGVGKWRTASSQLELWLQQLVMEGLHLSNPGNVAQSGAGDAGPQGTIALVARQRKKSLLVVKRFLQLLCATQDHG